MSGPNNVQFKHFDNRLQSRIKDIMLECRSADADDILEKLTVRFPRDYGRRPKNPFKKVINGIIDAVKPSLPPEEVNTNTKDDIIAEETDPEDEIVPYEDTNLLNRSLNVLYGAPKTPVNGNADIFEGQQPVKKKKRKLSRKNEPGDSKDVDQQVIAAIKEKAKANSKEILLFVPSVKFSDLAGIESAVAEVSQILIHMKYPALYRCLGVTPLRGFLLHGPPGCGKTYFASAIAGELGLPMLKVAAPEIVAGVSGESEQRIRDYFEKAIASAPCIFFIDEIDAITPKREHAQREMERRIVAQLLSSLDDLSGQNCTAEVLVIGATSRPDSLDPALRRAGRFDREIRLGIPTETERAQIIAKLTSPPLNVAPGGLNIPRLAHLTPGYVCADLVALVREASILAINRILVECNLDEEALREKFSNLVAGDLPEELVSSVCLRQEDFEGAVKVVQPSAKREGFATVPDVTWDNVGALKHIREALELSIVAPIRYREHFESLGLTTSSGILLHGPPGCGKTMVAKAIANESGLNFISVKGPELLNMYVGESERGVRACFERARNSAPCVIFFDEIDALCPRRSGNSQDSTSRLVNQMLTEMDGVESRRQVFVLAATNRLDIIDRAMLRPGRFDQVLYVGLPTREDRIDILTTITHNGTRPQFGGDVTMEGLADESEGFSGADLSALVKQASLAALKEFIQLNRPSLSSSTSSIDCNSSSEKFIISVGMHHFKMALEHVKPSVSSPV